MRLLLRKAFTAAIAILAWGAVAEAQTENLVLHYNFENVEGNSVSDASPSGVTATLRNKAKVEQMGKFAVLNLGTANGYLDMSAKAGEVVKDLTSFTVSVCYRVDESASLSGAGYFLWAFSELAANEQTKGPYSGYRLNAQRFATSPNGWGNEVGVEKGGEAVKGVWQNVVYVQSGSTGKVYLDGTLVGTLANAPTYKSVFASKAPACNWIGRAPFASDSYLKSTLVADFRVYDIAVSNDAVAELAAVASELEHEFKYGTPGDFEAFRREIAKCEEFVASSAGKGYLQNAIDEVQDEINIARKVAEAGVMSQSLLDGHVENMKRAMAQAEKSKGFEIDEASAFEPIDRGFTHPGGLHTQADFDRVKSLLESGDKTIAVAWKVLCDNYNAQASVATYPVETIIRGGGSGQNYMNACRGAAMAYQNALRWKISGNKANGDGAVHILMAWARGNKYVSGDTNMSLAAGLTGYQFAQAAELMRDYEGWSRTEFEEFKRYMLVTWYPVACNFLRSRHDTWMNWRNPSMGERPGHYWSNWGLCNTLFLMQLGILCDDVHIYNQGVSFYKYDHVGTFRDRSKDKVIVNDGCNEFIGNLVPVVLPDERGPLGYLGQMQESGRDQGHALMALGLAVDICKVALNQGDDLFAYMDDRLAAGIEHVAALNFGGVKGSDLPWIGYNYADCRGRLYQGWQQDAPNEGGMGGWRPYWDRIIGYYEGVRGVKMRYSEIAAKAVRGAGGADGGGGHYGETSGGYDHLGFTTLMDYRPETADPKDAPVILSGKMLCDGEVLEQTNMGGLKYTYKIEKTRAVEPGKEVTLMPQLPKSVTDNGSWRWNTGETTKDITVTANRSYVYRVSYTADNGAVSQQSFAIAVAGDCCADYMRPEITVDGVIYVDTVKSVLYGDDVILYAGNSSGWTDDYKWSNGATGNLIVIPNITSDRTYTVSYTNQGGNTVHTRFHLKVQDSMPCITVGSETHHSSQAVITTGQNVKLELQVPEVYGEGEWRWNNEATERVLTLEKVKTSGEYAVEYVVNGEAVASGTFRVLVQKAGDSKIEEGNYLVRHADSDTYLTNIGGLGSTPVLAPRIEGTDASQVWGVRPVTTPTRFSFVSLSDSTYIDKTGELTTNSKSRFRLNCAVGTLYTAVRNTATSGNVFWAVDDAGTISFEGTAEQNGFPFELVATDYVPVGIDGVIEGKAKPKQVEFFTVSGMRLSTPQAGGMIIKRSTYADGTVKVEKVVRW